MKALYFVTSTGEIISLHNGDTFLSVDAKSSLFAAPVNLAATQLPQVDGVVVQQSRLNARNIQIPVRVIAPDGIAREKAVEKINSLYTAAGRLGQLWYVNDNGNGFRMNCYFAGGLESFDLQKTRQGGTMTLKFYAYDPYWYEDTMQSSTITAGLAGVYFLDEPFIPLKLNESKVFGGETITLLGVDAFPVWYITGIVTQVNDLITVIRNETTGKEIRLKYELLAGDVLEINTEPRSVYVKFNGVNAFDARVLSGSEFFPLVRGENVITVLADTGAGAQVEARYYRRFILPVVEGY